MTETIRQTILDLDRAVPRYTSYPTAPHFKAIGDNALQAPYADIDANDPISLYIHIPFCPKLCWYCGCHTKITKQYDPVTDYVELLLKEISLVRQSLLAPLTVGHMHFGGGSPGMLSPADFSRVMEAIQSNFNIQNNAEIAIEVDPRETSEEQIATYAKYGVNRISLGAQDFHDKSLEAVNREQPFELSETTIAQCHAHGINKINLDIMYGMPYQTVETMAETFRLALTLNPDRVAFFGYAHVPWMKKHMRLIEDSLLPDKELRYDLFATGAKILEDAGYTSIGIDHFAKDDDPMTQAFHNGTLHRNFQGYTADPYTVMVGLGLSSIGKTHNGYLQNYPQMPLYKQAIEQNKLPIAKSCIMSKDDKIRGAIIERLMCDFYIDLDQYEGDYTDELTRLEFYADKNLITIDGQKITIHNDARPVARVICSEFDIYLAQQHPGQKRHSKAV